MPRLITTCVALATLGTISYAQGPICSCPTGTPALYANQGGDSTPLLWRFEAYQKEPPGSRQKQIICYVKHVENRSANDVRDILWDVAGYRRDVIRSNMARPSCVDYEGGMKLAPDRGPLHHGVSSQPYDTTVRAPESGWLNRTAQAASDQTLLDHRPLKSDFVLDTRAKDGQLRTSHVSVESLASYDGKVGVFTFNIANDGDGALAVFLNVPLTPQMYKDVPIAEKPVFLRPKERVSFKAMLSGRPEVAPGTVVFYGEDGNQAAQETAGFYVPAGGKSIRSDEDLWKPMRR
jgi:hypothetical protein